MLSTPTNSSPRASSNKTSQTYLSGARRARRSIKTAPFGYRSSLLLVVSDVSNQLNKYYCTAVASAIVRLFTCRYRGAFRFPNHYASTFHINVGGCQNFLLVLRGSQPPIIKPGLFNSNVRVATPSAKATLSGGSSTDSHPTLAAFIEKS